MVFFYVRCWFEIYLQKSESIGNDEKHLIMKTDIQELSTPSMAGDIGFTLLNGNDMLDEKNLKVCIWKFISFHFLYSTTKNVLWQKPLRTVTLSSCTFNFWLTIFVCFDIVQYCNVQTLQLRTYINSRLFCYVIFFPSITIL